MALFDVADLQAQIHSAVTSLETNDPVGSINACLHCAQQIMTACKQAPDAALAYFTCTLPEQTPPATRTILRSLTLLCITGRRDHLNDHSLQHVVAATLLAYARIVTPGVTAATLKPPLLRRGLSMWLGILRLSRSLLQPESHQLLRRASLKSYERRVISACHLALVTPKQTPAHCLRDYIHRSPVCYQPMYESWLGLPGGIANGQLLILSDNRRGTVLSLQPDYVALAFNDEDNTVCEWLPRRQIPHQPMRAVSFDQWKVLFARHREDLSVHDARSLYPLSYPIHRPPASLTRIIDALQKPDSDIDMLVALIDQEPSFATFLLSSASLDNRMQLPVSSLKQAILTFGLERIGDMLVQHALAQRLAQHRFALDGACHQFATLMASIAAQLSLHVKSRFTPQSAALTATFLSAPLFTIADLKVLMRLPLSNSGYYDPNQLLRLTLNSRWQSLAGELASGWHQAATWRALLHHAGKPPASVPASLRKEHCILQIAQILSRQWLFGEGTPCEETRAVLNAGLTALAITDNDIRRIQQSLASQLLCPLVY